MMQPQRRAPAAMTPLPNPKPSSYERPVDLTMHLIGALRLVLLRHPEQRLGQTIFNLTRDEDLFTVTDENLLSILQAMAKGQG